MPCPSELNQLTARLMSCPWEFPSSEFPDKRMSDLRVGRVLLDEMKSPHSTETSSELLRRSCETGDDDAFSTLVHRHMDHVYSVALRRVAGAAHLASDVSQTVFVDLACKVHGRRCDISRFDPLSGWLHRHTCFVAAKMVRSDRRRKAREDQAFMNSQPSFDTDWSRLAPWIDDAVNLLPPADRDALILRFFERHDLKSIGNRLGVTEDAAQKRVARALDRLRAILAERGIASTATALGISIGEHAVASAPPGLSATVLHSALVAASTAAGPPLLSFLSIAQWKPVAVYIAILSTGAALLIQHRENVRLREENSRLSIELAQRTTPAPTSNAVANEEMLHFQSEHAELLRLRGEVARLLRAQQLIPVASPPQTISAAQAVPGLSVSDAVQVNQRFVSASGQPSPPESAIKVSGKRINSSVEISALNDSGSHSPVDAAKTLLWAALHDSRDFSLLVADDSSMFGPGDKNKQKDRLRISLLENLRNSMRVDIVMQWPEASPSGGENVAISLPQKDRTQPVGVSLVFKPDGETWKLEQLAVVNGRASPSGE